MEKRNSWYMLGAIILTAMLLLPTTSAWSEEARAGEIVLHVSTLSDGKTEKTLSFAQPSTDKTMSITIPNGARIVNASLNITGLPFVDGGADFPENVTVDLGNDGTPEWAFKGKAYGAMGNQSMFSSGASSLEVQLPSNGGTNSTPSIRLPKNATVTSANMNVKSRSKILVIYGDKDLNTVNDIVNKLKKYSDQLGEIGTFDGSTGTPTLAQLKQYAACFVYIAAYSGFTNYASWANPSGLGDVLADYVDGGGGVVTANYCWYYTGGSISGRFVSGGYYMLPTQISGMSGTSFNMGTVSLPNHPIMNNVKSISFTTTAWCQSCTSPVNGGTTVFAWTFGPYVGAAVKTMNNGVNRVDLHMNPWSDNVPNRGTGGQGYTGDGDILFKNSLLWTGGGGGTGNFSLDFANDGGFEWFNPALNGSEAVPDFSAALNTYLAKAASTGTDEYGNEYVDVPVAVSSNGSGVLALSNLSVIYRLTSGVGINPASGDLAGALNALVPRTYDMKSTNIPIAIYSNHSGKIKLSGIKIDFTLFHPAIIQTRTPEDVTVYMSENSTQEFSITATDPYDFPMSVKWSVNKKVYLQDEWDMSWFADYDANGTYSVTASVNNGEQNATTSWYLIVKNVNRKPVIDSFEPEKKYTMDENSSAVFTVMASDPDKDDLSYAWYADGKRVSGEEATYEYRTTYASAGKHEVKVTVLDIAGASTVQSWDITVNNVNAVPEVTDSSPAGDDVSMDENSTKKFTVTDLAIDGDKHVISWLLDQNSTGVTGRTYEYKTDFDSAGRHDVSASISDGKLATTRTWNVNVVDVNRAPVAAIAVPAPGAEFMVGEEITLDGTRSSDPDGDQLSMTWTEGLKTLGTGQTLTVKLSKGKHTIVLKVDDGRKNGQATTQVLVFVRYIDFGGALTVDTDNPVEGKAVKLSAVLANKGDGNRDELQVAFKVDGTEMATTTIENIGPGSDYPLEFTWKAVKGDHKLEVSVNNQNFSKLVAVAKKPTAATTGPDMLMPLLIVAVLAVVALAVGGAVMAGRRKRAGGLPEEDGRVEERPEERAPYKPMQKATPAAAPSSASAAGAKKAIDRTEKILGEAEKVGLDTTKARSLLKVARNMQGMGKADKAVEFCKKAEDAVG